MTTVSNKDLVDMWDALLRNGRTNAGTPKFKWNLAKNKNRLKSHRDALSEGAAEDPEEALYAKERLQIYEKCAVKTTNEVKDKDGGATTTTQLVVPPENMPKLEAEMKKLDEEHAEALANAKLRILGMPDLLKATFEVEFHKIKMSTVPKEISADDLAILWDLWEDDLDDVEGEPAVPDEKAVKDPTPE